MTTRTKSLVRNSIITLLVLTSVACSDMIEQERQENLQRCQRACSSVFASYPQYYTMCMNSGMDSSGYYQGSACERYIKPHLFCMGSGLAPSNNQSGQATDYSSCVINHQEKEADRDLTREIIQKPETSSGSNNQQRVCYTDSQGYQVCY